jgi:hypothetical protein
VVHDPATLVIQTSARTRLEPVREALNAQTAQGRDHKAVRPRTSCADPTNALRYPINVDVLWLAVDLAGWESDSRGVKRALAVLTVAAFLTLAVGVLGGDGSLWSLLPAGAFTLLAIVGFDQVQRRNRRPLAIAYVTVQVVPVPRSVGCCCSWSW